MRTPIVASLVHPMVRTIGEAGAQRYFGPSLSLDFINQQYSMGAVWQKPTAKSFSALVTLTRSTGGGRFNAAGVYEWVAANQPRFDYDPLTLTPLGLLIEEQRTNLCLQSDSILTLPWIGQTGSIESTIPSPDGTFNSTRLNYGTVAQTYQLLTVTPGQQYTFSYFVRLGTKPSNSYAVYDHTNSAFLVAATVNASATTARWTRLTVTFTTPANCTQVRIYPDRNDSAGVTGTIYLWRVQLEAGAFATSPIPTATAQVTRAADVVSVNVMAPWYRQSEGTIVVKGDLLNRNASTKVSVDIGAGGALGTTLFIKHITSFDIANPDTAPISVASIANNATLGFRCALAMRRNDMLLASNGALGSADTACEIPVSPTRLTLGAGGWTAAGGYLNGHLRSVAYYPRRLPNTDLQALTAA
ncbi:Carbohydrate binding domain-containing protein [Azotobacter beijerinckii]|uniref:Carbohydrate binding domain-containing protein n=1 Tax=Azotobacter beijerinckii TaxID=170623 RepID=A0A1H9MR81_9GAMM|nr:carbohydrate binding domain-containing protein [Azotobacter beijerinckii]SER25663.1 Carbohydrate binding domain-containing protein [Azotobacter beijerinckii]